MTLDWLAVGVVVKHLLDGRSQLTGKASLS
jgi:hypothetical protein